MSTSTVAWTTSTPLRVNTREQAAQMAGAARKAREQAEQRKRHAANVAVLRDRAGYLPWEDDIDSDPAIRLSECRPFKPCEACR